MDVLVSIMDILTDLHSKGVTHRDIHSRNSLVTPDGEVKLIDFYRARVDSPNSEVSDLRKMLGSLLGVFERNSEIVNPKVIEVFNSGAINKNGHWKPERVRNIIKDLNILK